MLKGQFLINFCLPSIFSISFSVSFIGFFHAFFLKNMLAVQYLVSECSTARPGSTMRGSKHGIIPKLNNNYILPFVWKKLGFLMSTNI